MIKIMIKMVPLKVLGTIPMLIFLLINQISISVNIALPL